MTVSEELKSAIDQFCRSLESLWSLPSFRPFFWSPQTRRTARTVAGPGAELLPITGRPIRGRPGTEIQLPERPRSSEEYATDLIFESWSRPDNSHSEELRNRLNLVREKADALEEVIDGSPRLSYRLYQARGFKTWSSAEFMEASQQEGWGHRLRYLIALAPLLGEQLVALGFEKDGRESFDEWDQVILNVYSQLESIEAADNYEYEVRIFLNGPPVDSAEDIEVMRLRVGGRPVAVSIAYASDEIMRPLVEYESTPGFEKVNTVVRYKIPVPVESGEDVYEAEYANAALIAESVLDGLRLYRPDEDVGVLALEVVPIGVLTPRIRKTWANRFNADLARFQPRRFDFAPSSAEPLSSDELDNLDKTVLKLLPDIKDEWRYRHAVERFRRSIEAYSPSDPERILEYAIALEALYLSGLGTARGELTYRLSLRAARFLESAIDKRQEVFSLVSKLYNLRSRISHGEDIRRLSKQKDQEDLNLVLDKAPSIVARSILGLLHGPPDIQSDPLEFWRRVELG